MKSHKVKKKEIIDWMTKDWRVYASVPFEGKGKVIIEANRLGVYKVKFTQDENKRTQPRVIYEGKNALHAEWCFNDPYMVMIRNGILYQRCLMNQKIQENAIHSLDGGHTWKPLMNSESIGDIPANFSEQRIFYNPTTILNDSNESKNKEEQDESRTEKK